MADETDISQVESDFLLSLTLNSRRQYRGESPKSCVVCGTDIPLARREALPGITQCVVCAERQEKHVNRLYR